MIDQNAASILEYLCQTPVDEYGGSGPIMLAEIEAALGLARIELDSAVEFLDRCRSIRIHAYEDSCPYSVDSIELLQAGREISDPTISIASESILDCLISHERALSGAEISQETGLSAIRVNYAIKYSEWRDYLKATRGFGSAPFRFLYANITEHGKRYLYRRAVLRPSWEIRA